MRKIFIICMTYVCHMEVPIYSPPDMLNELINNFRYCFRDIRQFKHFQEIISTLDTTDKRSIAHMNSTVIGHTNQSSMNRFLSSKINTNLMFKKTVEMINNIEKYGILYILDPLLLLLIYLSMYTQ